MAATLTQDRFSGPEWIFERKFDGIRLLAFKHGADVRLFSRNRQPLNSSYPAVVQAIASLPVHDVILDGEAIGGWERFGSADYYVFDILWLDGRDVTSLPLDERRALLDGLSLRPADREGTRRWTMPGPGNAPVRRAGRALSPSDGARHTSIVARRAG